MKTTTSYAITGLSCNNCVAKVHSTLTPFADSVEVALKPPQLMLTGQKESIETLNALLKNIGNYQIGAEIFSENHIETSDDDGNKPFFIIYKPLLLVFFYILLVTLAVEVVNGNFELHRFMPNFMAGFFLVFSFFKMPNSIS
jgi:copper chaperone CopZ